MKQIRKFIAFDGKEFASKTDCAVYEERQKLYHLLTVCDNVRIVQIDHRGKETTLFKLIRA